ncbi:MAG: hypothetical protein U5O16_23445 [Rhodococcus sp. (in: high G+C Gram-positive bacteria)]|uniref:hypothetical protein n=1 Tax=Rhodococcus sp. TaxID=1831 RepID=UPI002AD92A53|nr:hypothetical protein [Rhodococcus sp. (in: high G+C Gram-positive bacteria)]
MTWVRIGNTPYSAAAAAIIETAASAAVSETEVVHRPQQTVTPEKSRHRTVAVGMSRRLVAALSGAVLAGCGIAYVATTHGLLP